MSVKYHYTIPRRLELSLVTEPRSYPAHIHAGSYTIGLICAGSVTLSFGQEGARQLQPFESFIVPPRTPHILKLMQSEGNDSCRLFSVSVDEGFVSESQDFLSQNSNFLLRQLCQELLEQGQVTFTEINLLQYIVARELSEARWHTSGFTLPPSLERLTQSLAQSPDIDSGLKDLASANHLSPWHFLRLFKEKVGMTPHQFCLACQVSLGRRLLRDGASPVEAALSAGFTDQSHFYRHFKRLSGMTPGSFSRQSVSIKLG